MRKILASLPLALLALTLVPSPASAHSGHENFLQWRSPGDGQSVSGPAVAIRARVSFDDGVRDWSVEVLGGSDHPEFGRICSQTVGGSPGSSDIECIWDTTDYAGGGKSENGEYRIKITATNAGRGLLSPRIEAHSGERAVKVNNPTSPPRNVKLSFSEVSRQATVRWDPNSEPDIVRYVIQERRASEPWQTVGETPATTTTFARRLSTPGSYRYQVAAQRSDGSNGTLQSSWSGPSSEPRELVVPDTRKPAPNTTTTTGPPSQAGSGPPPDQPAPGPGDVPPGGAPVSGGTTEGGPPPAEGDRAAAAAPPPEAVRPGGGLLFTPIQSGTPGSVQSKEKFSGKVVNPSAPSPAPRPREAEEKDTGYDVALPYPKRDNQGNQHPDGIVGVLTRLPTTLSDQDRRPLIVPLAAGLLLFVFAMHALYLSRRAEERMVQADGDPGADFDD
jgi:hypothetical protein